MELESLSRISSHLGPNETLLWSGVPRRGVALRAADAFQIPFSIFWCGFMAFWMRGALNQGAPTFFVLFGVPFALIGVYLLIGRFVIDSMARGKTFYGLTNQRVIIVSGLRSQQTTSLPLSNLADISLQEKSGGRGTVLFGRPHPFAAMYAGMQWPGMGHYRVPSFELIENASQVHASVLAAQHAAA